MQDSVLPQGCGGGVAPTSSLLSLLSLLSLRNPFIPSKFSSKSLTQVCHFFENFGDFSPVENFFELSTSYLQFTFIDAVFLKIFRRIGGFLALLLNFIKIA